MKKTLSHSPHNSFSAYYKEVIYYLTLSPLFEPQRHQLTTDMSMVGIIIIPKYKMLIKLYSSLGNIIQTISINLPYIDYQNTLQDHVEFTDMKIAVSRPKSLRDLLCRTRLPNDVKQVTAILNQLQTNLQTNA